MMPPSVSDYSQPDPSQYQAPEGDHHPGFGTPEPNQSQPGGRPQSAAIRGRGSRHPPQTPERSNPMTATGTHIITGRSSRAGRVGSAGSSPSSTSFTPPSSFSQTGNLSTSSSRSRRPPNYARLAEIAKPVNREYSEISGSFEDIKHCTFQPHLSQTSKLRAAMTTGTTFLERLEAYTRHYHEERNRTPDPRPEWTFAPRVQGRRRGSDASGEDVGARLARYNRRALTPEEMAEEQKRLHPDWTYKPNLSNPRTQEIWRTSDKCRLPFEERWAVDCRKRMEARNGSQRTNAPSSPDDGSGRNKRSFAVSLDSFAERMDADSRHRHQVQKYVGLIDSCGMLCDCVQVSITARLPRCSHFDFTICLTPRPS